MGDSSERFYSVIALTAVVSKKGDPAYLAVLTLAGTGNSLTVDAMIT